MVDADARAGEVGEYAGAAEVAGRWLLVAPQTARAPANAAAKATFSIVIAAYNAGAFLGEAIESALAQSAPADEIVVCDDGSTDHTVSVAAAYGDRIVRVSQDHRGVGAAKNACTRAASSDFLVVLDADNVLLPECLEALRAAVEKRPDLDIVTTDGYLELDGRIFDRYYRQKARFVVDDQRRAALHQHFVYGQAALRRSAVEAVGGYDEFLPCGVDTDLFLRMILAGSRAGLVLEPLSIYRLRPGSLSSDRARSMEAFVTMLERARSDPSLTPGERAFLDGDLELKRHLALLAVAERELRNRGPRARALTGAIARNLPPGFARGDRVAAAIAWLAPPLARHALRLRDGRVRSRLRSATHGR